MISPSPLSKVEIEIKVLKLMTETFARSVYGSHVCLKCHWLSDDTVNIVGPCFYWNMLLIILNCNQHYAVPNQDLDQLNNVILISKYECRLCVQSCNTCFQFYM